MVFNSITVKSYEIELVWFQTTRQSNVDIELFN